MVHVRKCPCEYGRGRPITQFVKDGKPQIYCLGVYDRVTDMALDICQKCPDWADGEQCFEDFQRWAYGR